ncbi:hypothetical protein BXY51_003355 [Actinoplanes cyaneus]|nr:hypothetical protein [Actinoplanes cyaneus]
MRDTIEATYDRFAVVSAALAAYLGLVFDPSARVVERAPIQAVEALAGDDPGFGQIALAELLDTRDDAMQRLTGVMAAEEWTATHPQ